MNGSLVIMNISIELSGVLLCLLGIVLVLLGTRVDQRISRYFLLMFTFLLFSLAANIFGILVEGRPGIIFGLMYRVFVFCEYYFEYLLIMVFSRYLLGRKEIEGDKRKFRTIVWLYLAVQTCMLVLTQFTGWYYWIESPNIYHRGPMIGLSLMFSGVMILFDMLQTLRSRQNFSRNSRTVTLTYMIIILAAGTLQIFVEGIYLILFALIVVAVAEFIRMMVQQTEAYYAKERESTELRQAVMISQIQPHFLYNTLDSIYYLCGKDPARAQKAVSDFSEYLRGNLGSLTAKEPVPFSTERHHVETYLQLEKMSSEDTLSYSFDIEGEDFLVPALSVQPLVENAVKHGLGRKVGGGTVVIRTRSYPDRWVITVQDDGMGFDPDKAPGDSRTHIGIKSVRARVQEMCGGSLEINSQPGNGTTAAITIPKGGAR